MAVEAYELRDGVHVPVEMPSRDEPPGGVGSGDDQARNGTGSLAETAPGSAPGEQGGSAPQDDRTPPAGEGLAAPQPAEEDDPDVPDDTATVPFVNRRIKQLNAKRRALEQQVAAERQQFQVELAQTRGQLEMVQRLLQGAAPALPDTPAKPSGPPQAEQYASHEDYVLAAARYGAQQELQARDQQTAEQRQQAQQLQFQQALMQREQDFKAQHSDFDTVVRGGLAGKVSPVLQQALMLVPDGPAVAYTLARQPELVQRLNTLPPPLVLVELGRLSPPPQTAAPTPAVGSTNGTPPPALPTPLTPLSGSGAGAPTGTYSDGMDQAAYRAWRKRTSDIPTWKER